MSEQIEKVQTFTAILSLGEEDISSPASLKFGIPVFSI